MRISMKATSAAWIALAALAFAPGSSGFAQEIQLKTSTFIPPGNPLVKAMEQWADELKAKSNGRLVIKLFPSSQMGPPPRQFDLARTGVADMSIIMHGATPGRFPLTELVHLPGVVKSIYGSSVGLSEVAQDVVGMEYPGVKIIHLLANPTLIISRNEIKSANDLKGKRIRAAGSVQSDVLAALGAVPTLIQPGEMTDALHKGMVEGVSTAYSGIASYKMEDIAKFIAEGDMGSVTFMTVMNQAAYDKLPPDLRKLIDDSSGAVSGKLFGRIFADDEAKLRTMVQERGVKIQTLSDDAPLKQASAKIQDEALKKAAAKGVNAREVLEKLKAAAAKFGDQR